MDGSSEGGSPDDDGTRPPATRHGLGRGLASIIPERAAGPPGALRHLAERRSTHSQHPGRDPLTGLASRAELVDRLDGGVLARSGTDLGAHGMVAVVALGVNGLRHVNAVHGYDVGDTLLWRLGERLVASRRETDLVSRLGGDEFCVVCTQVASASVVPRILDRLSTQVGAPITAGAVEHRVQATFGVVLSDPARRLSARTLLRRADLAMHQAKDAGQRWVLFEADGGAHHRPRWNTSSNPRVGRRAEVVVASSAAGLPISTAPR